MKENKKTRLARTIKTILDVIYGMLLFVILGLIIWIAISPALINRTGMGGTSSIRVSLGSDEFDNLELEFQDNPGLAIRNAWIAEAQGTLRIESGSYWLMLLTNGSKLVTAVGLAYIFSLLRRVMRSILAGDPFREENIKLIRRIGYAFLVVGFGGPILEGGAACMILNRLPKTIPALRATAMFDAPTLLGTALLIFLLSQIWSYGLELERDRALTV